MARAKTKPLRVKKPTDLARAAAIRLALAQVGAVVVIVSLSVVGFSYLRKHVDRNIVFTPIAPRIVLKDRPTWMTDFLAEQIAKSAQPAGAHSAFNHQLLVDVGTTLQANPWIKRVKQIRRAFGNRAGDTIEVDCEYRAPVALVHWKDYYWLVDGDGVKLPEQFTEPQLPQIVMGADHKMNIRIIEGVRQPPVQSGRKWPGEDLAAGLELARQLYGKSFVEEIARIDVANYAGREDPKEAQVVLVTKRGSEVRWGRPISAKDFFVEVSTQQKLKYLQQVYDQFGRVDANQPWIDIRFDKITYPSGAGDAHAIGR